MCDLVFFPPKEHIGMNNVHSLVTLLVYNLMQSNNKSSCNAFHFYKVCGFSVFVDTVRDYSALFIMEGLVVNICNELQDIYLSSYNIYSSTFPGP